ncbi:phage terminase large subunit family protein [Candidatus Babeliales bacterium]|nr:phage terminase large subunit family protein [Candidatus Babeliales bacterium]
MGISRVKTFRQGVQTSVNRHSLKKSAWICENFKHPRNDRIPWSFDDHEYQIDILDEPSSDKCVKKCAQVGMSELSIRDSLAFCAMSDFRKMAYVLPTSKFSSEFSSTRFDPAIASSPYIQSVISKDVDNTGVKKIGSSFLVMRGTSGTTAAISIDLDGIITDETDFCNQDVLGSFASRLQHSDLKLTSDFSTPTVPDYGISALFDTSSKARYRVRHSKCGRLVAPGFYNDVVIPGFDEPLTDYTKADRFHPGVVDAYMSCPRCRRKIDWTDFTNEVGREWVHEFPGRPKAGFHVMPWDVPKYNPLADVLFSIHKYKLHSDWVNFRLGLDHSSAEDSFLKEIMDRNTSGLGATLKTIASQGYRRVFVGADLGKTSWVVVGVPTAAGLRVVCAESVKVATLPNANLGEYLAGLFRRLLGQKIIVDAAPNYETAMYLSKNLYEKQAYGAYYGGAKTNILDIYNFNASEGIVSIDRDGSFDDLAKAVNSGIVSFAEPTEFTEDKEGNKQSVIQKHLLALKKVKKMTNKGPVMTWTNTGPDHYGHALNYCYAAYASVNERYEAEAIIGPGISKVKLKETA